MPRRSKSKYNLSCVHNARVEIQTECRRLALAAKETRAVWTLDAWFRYAEGKRDWMPDAARVLCRAGVMQEVVVEGEKRYGLKPTRPPAKTKGGGRVSVVVEEGSRGDVRTRVTGLDDAVATAAVTMWKSKLGYRAKKDKTTTDVVLSENHQKEIWMEVCNMLCVRGSRYCCSILAQQPCRCA
jgi:hypothetical protein